MNEETIRLQKVLAECGICSRRTAATYIEEGRIRVNGAVVDDPGRRVMPATDRIELDGRLLTDPPAKRTILLYKPRGYICSARADQGKTVHELVTTIPERLVTVGRLDKNSEGLLLMSNDGDLVNRLTHPRYGHTKIYQVTVSGSVDEAALRVLNSRMVIDGYQIQPARVRLLKRRDNGRHVLRFELQEGRNRQVRNMCQIAGLKVHRLVRVQFGDLMLKKLAPGEWRPLSADEMALLG